MDNEAYGPLGKRFKQIFRHRLVLVRQRDILPAMAELPRKRIVAKEKVLAIPRVLRIKRRTANRTKKTPGLFRYDFNRLHRCLPIHMFGLETTTAKWLNYNLSKAKLFSSKKIGKSEN
jgi:hypothetical protein